MAQEILDVPSYPRSAWLEDSLLTADLIVLGQPEQDRLRVEKVLRGPSLEIKSVKIDPVRFDKGTGVYLLIRAPDDAYYNINPDAEPLPLAEWSQLAKDLVPPESPPLTVHQSKNQIYRTYQKGKDAVWHGTNIHRSSELFVERYAHGEKIAGRAWDHKGRLERVYRLPKRGPGFYLQFRKGQVWRFTHYLDDKKVGVERVYFPNGTLKEALYWRAGIRHGRSRTFDDKGKVTWEQTYEEGFIPPIIRYRGKEKKGAELHKSEFGVTYSASGDLIQKIKVGMRTKEVSKIIATDLAEGTGLRFVGFTCELDYQVRFEKGRVVSAAPIQTGRHCEY